MNLRLTYIALLLLNTLSFNVLANELADDSRVSIPFQLINGLIIVEAEIDDVVGNYIFDTGAEELILNKEVGSGKTMFSSISGEIATEEVYINLLRIGNLTHSKVRAYSTDLGSMESYLNMPLQGVIGCNLFVPRKVKIDFTNNQIIMSSQDDLTDDKSNFVSFEMLDGVPVCPVEINEQQFLFGFDTGASMHVLDKNVMNALKTSITDTGLDSYVSTGTGKKTVNKIFEVDEMTFGSDTFDKAHFLIQDLNEFNQSMEQPISGVLSITALAKSDIVIDLQQKRIYF